MGKDAIAKEKNSYSSCATEANWFGLKLEKKQKCNGKHSFEQTSL